MLPSNFSSKQTPVDKIDDSFLASAGISLSVLRCDLIHEELSGNKWFKLKHNLQAAKEQGCKTLLSFGGAWSNHIHALAAAGKLFDFETIGCIRGEEGQILNPCLSDAVANGMTLHWISREQYREKVKATFIKHLKEELGDFFLIPEGGSNLLGVKGCSEILTIEQVDDYDLVALACGTGTTLTGILSNHCPRILGFQVLKGQGYLSSEVNNLLEKYDLEAKNKWNINDEYHFGAYAKSTPALMSFINEFQSKTNIPLEPVYSGKMLYGIYDLIKQNYFEKGTKILIIHGGGLQGARGF